MRLCTDVALMWRKLYPLTKLAKLPRPYSKEPTIRRVAELKILESPLKRRQTE